MNEGEEKKLGKIIKINCKQLDVLPSKIINDAFQNLFLTKSAIFSSLS